MLESTWSIQGNMLMKRCHAQVSIGSCDVVPQKSLKCQRVADVQCSICQPYPTKNLAEYLVASSICGQGYHIFDGVGTC